jgi:signal peptidase I
MTQSAASVSTIINPDPDEDKTNVKETIESILVAFILAFIFRAFVVEAFVIPTGSMAPTLLGAHMRYVCPDCGYTFDVNYQSRTEEEDEDMRTPPEAFPPLDVYCPNCGYLVASHERRNSFGEITNPQDATPVNYGDRILVLKYLYLLHPPQRWDVVVFKSPDEPKEYHYEQNFIKRLVGLPGEQLMVLDGNVYIKKTPDGAWEIPLKTPEAQDALWRLVYDNDFHPTITQRAPGQLKWVQPWRADGAGWDASGRQFKFDNATGSGILRFDPNANSTTQTLTDYLVYDSTAGLPYARRPEPAGGSYDDENANPVSDLKLTAYYQRHSGDGALRLQLTKTVDVTHTFTAQIEPDGVRLIHQTNDFEVADQHKSFAELGISPNQPIMIDFENVDYRVTLRLNGKDAFEPLAYAPNINWLMDQYHNHPRGRRAGEATIEAEHQQCTLDHVGLWRDVFYTNRSGGMTLHSATPDDPVKLGKGEFFTMGDNSAISKDARYWDAPIDLPHEGLEMKEGRVPEQFMLGKAVFVYWPAGYRLFGTRISLIPNFGDMRWIH